jgi:hypothetical protein
VTWGFRLTQGASAVASCALWGHGHRLVGGPLGGRLRHDGERVKRQAAARWVQERGVHQPVARHWGLTTHPNQRPHRDKTHARN